MGQMLCHVNDFACGFLQVYDDFCHSLCGHRKLLLLKEVQMSHVYDHVFHQIKMTIYFEGLIVFFLFLTSSLLRKLTSEDMIYQI